MEELIENIEKLLKKHAENVSANHWINAIHEDKFSDLAQEISDLFKDNIPLPDKDNYDYLRGFTDGYGGEEPHEVFPEGFKNLKEVMDRMDELNEKDSY
jgi:hypothetical protein